MMISTSASGILARKLKLRSKYDLSWADETKETLQEFDIDLQKEFDDNEKYPKMVTPQLKELGSDGRRETVLQSIERGNGVVLWTRRLEASPVPTLASKNQRQKAWSARIIKSRDYKYQSTSETPVRITPVYIDLTTPVIVSEVKGRENKRRRTQDEKKEGNNDDEEGYLDRKKSRSMKRARNVDDEFRTDYDESQLGKTLEAKRQWIKQVDQTAGLRERPTKGENTMKVCQYEVKGEPDEMNEDLYVYK